MTKFQNNDLFFLIKKIKWPKSLFIIAVFTVSLGSVSELIVPLLTGKFIDMLVTESIQYRFFINFRCFIYFRRFIKWDRTLFYL